MAIDQKPPLPNFGPKNPQQPLDLEKIFNEERIDLKALMDSRKLTKEINKTLAPYTGEFGDAQKKHLLKRTMVGYASRHLKDLEGLTMEQAVDKIMTFHELGEPVNNYYNELSQEAYKEKYGNDDVGPQEPFVSEAYIGRLENNNFSDFQGQERKEAIYSWMHHSMYAQPTSICWKLFIFLFNLTPTLDFHSIHKMIYSYIHLIYHGSFRNYRDFIYDLTLEPYMLEYLNLQLSQKETPDENYAREVQELFTVGKRPFSKFTEGDVQAAAKVLVGWNSDFWGENATGAGWAPVIRFNDWNHDTSDKQFSEFYGNTLIRGREGEAGAEELDEFIDMIFKTDEAAIYLSRRLFQFFVYPVLSDYVEENIIRPLADVMRSNNYNLAETLKVLLKSDYFYSEELYNSVIKGPYDFTLSVMKELDVLNGSLWTYSQNEQRDYNSSFSEDAGFFGDSLMNQDHRVYQTFRSFEWRLRNQGMNVFNPPSVSGWPAFYQEPVYDLFWLNSVTIKARKEFTDSASRWGLYLGNQNGNNIHLRFNLSNFIESFHSIESVDGFLNELTDRFLGGPIPDKALTRIKNMALGDSFNENHWGEEINRFKSDPSKENHNSLRNKISDFMHLIFQLNEIHVH
jgi:hypothetical protein